MKLNVVFKKTDQIVYGAFFLVARFFLSACVWTVSYLV